jgi:hypothetical protein
MLQTAEIPFKFEIPFEVFHKAGEPGKERRIGGVISTEDKDRQGEVVLQRGLDFSEFVQNGWFNDNHSKKTTDIVGYPIGIEKRVVNNRPVHYVEGYLLEGHEPADGIWKLANSLAKTNRRLGFSIEGSVQSRAGSTGSTIAKAKVREVAITKCPVNTSTGLEILAKSLMAVESEGEEWRRALAAGQAVSDPGVAPGQGFALRTESMERDLKRTRKLTRAEARDFLLARYRGMNKALADRIIDNVVARSLA